MRNSLSFYFCGGRSIEINFPVLFLERADKIKDVIEPEAVPVSTISFGLSSLIKA